jgi:hypothetical protein
MGFVVPRRKDRKKRVGDGNRNRIKAGVAKSIYGR